MASCNSDTLRSFQARCRPCQVSWIGTQTRWRQCPVWARFAASSELSTCADMLGLGHVAELGRFKNTSIMRGTGSSDLFTMMMASIWFQAAAKADTRRREAQDTRDRGPIVMMQTPQEAKGQKFLPKLRPLKGEKARVVLSKFVHHGLGTVVDCSRVPCSGWLFPATPTMYLAMPMQSLHA